MMFATDSFSFVDICNYCGKMSLRQFAQNYCTNELSSKGIFPYSLFNRIEDIRSCKTFPTYHAFKNDLNDPTDLEIEQ